MVCNRCMCYLGCCDIMKVENFRSAHVVVLKILELICFKECLLPKSLRSEIIWNVRNIYNNTLKVLYMSKRIRKKVGGFLRPRLFKEIIIFLLMKWIHVIGPFSKILCCRAQLRQAIDTHIYINTYRFFSLKYSYNSPASSGCSLFCIYLSWILLFFQLNQQIFVRNSKKYDSLFRIRISAFQRIEYMLSQVQCLHGSLSRI